MKSMLEMYRCEKNIVDLIEALKAGKAASRKSWGCWWEENYLVLDKGQVSYVYVKNDSIIYHPVKGEDMPYHLTYKDIIATDWIIFDKKVGDKDGE